LEEDFLATLKISDVGRSLKGELDRIAFLAGESVKSVERFFKICCEMRFFFIFNNTHFIWSINFGYKNREKKKGKENNTDQNTNFQSKKRRKNTY